MIATAELIEQPTFEDISTHAYLLWEKNGKPHGRHEEFWLEAERNLLNQIEKLIQETEKQNIPATKRKRATKASTTNVSPRKTKPSTPKKAVTKKTAKATREASTKTTATKSRVSSATKTKPKTKAKASAVKTKKSK